MNLRRVLVLLLLLAACTKAAVARAGERLNQDSVRAHAGLRAPRSLAIFEALWSARHEDRTPPAQTTDLAAKALGGGKVRLTWTAPGDDGREGRAAEYSVKHAPAPIVDFVGFWDEKTKTGWPDMTDPLPTTPAEYYKKAAKFVTKRKVSFWCRHNEAAAPGPARLAQKNPMVLKDAPAGTCCFAVVAFDEMPNARPLSNVAVAEIN